MLVQKRFCCITSSSFGYSRKPYLCFSKGSSTIKQAVGLSLCQKLFDEALEINIISGTKPEKYCRSEESLGTIASRSAICWFARSSKLPPPSFALTKNGLSPSRIRDDIWLCSFPSRKTVIVSGAAIRKLSPVNCLHILLASIATLNSYSVEFTDWTPTKPPEESLC